MKMTPWEIDIAKSWRETCREPLAGGASTEEMAQHAIKAAHGYPNGLKQIIEASLLSEKLRVIEEFNRVSAN